MPPGAIIGIAMENLVKDIRVNLINDYAFDLLEMRVRKAKADIDRQSTIEELQAKLVITQADYHKAMVKFNATNPSDKKRNNPPGYVSWPTRCVKFAQDAINNRDEEILGYRKAYLRYQWLLRNLDYVDSKIESNPPA